MGYDPTYGARPLKRVIQKHLVDRLALGLLQGDFAAGDHVAVDAADGELTLRRGRRAGREPTPACVALAGTSVTVIPSRTYDGSSVRRSSTYRLDWSNWTSRCPCSGRLIGIWRRAADSCRTRPAGAPCARVLRPCRLQT